MKLSYWITATLVTASLAGLQAAALTATTTTVTAAPNPVVIGSVVTYTVKVVGSGAPLTGETELTANGRHIAALTLTNGVSTFSRTVLGSPRTDQVVAMYEGDASNASSTSATLSVPIVAAPGLPTTTTTITFTNPVDTNQWTTYTATVTGHGSAKPTGTVTFFFGAHTLAGSPVALNSSTGTASTGNAFPTAGSYAITAAYSGDANNQGSASIAVGQQVNAVAPQPSLSFVPVPPCRIADTRNATGPFGGPAIQGGQTRNFAIPQSACGIPSTAAAYSLNVTVVPNGQLNYLTVWPTGQPIPTVSLLNSMDGRTKANAAIVPAGTSGSISVFAYTAATANVILDINGYFVSSVQNTSGLAFYPLTPCRLVDTRNPAGPLAGPYLAAGQARAFPVQSGSCKIPSTAQAYSLNVTAIPPTASGKPQPVNNLAVWPTGQAQPISSTLNATTGTVTANAAIVSAGTGGSLSVSATNNTDLLLDVNGYFAPKGSAGNTFLYTITPCRALDTRNYGATPFPGTYTVPIEGGGNQNTCTLSTAASAFVLNATVLPTATLHVLKLWPATAGVIEPTVSTLNAYDGAITSNMAIVPTSTGSINATATEETQLLIDVSAYFAP
jgi:Bacterial Ig-like domain (group 3)